MKIHRLLALAALSAALFVLTLVPARAADQTTTDADLAAFKALVAEKPPGLPKDLGNEKYFTWVGAQRDKISAAGFGFIEQQLL